MQIWAKRISLPKCWLTVEKFNSTQTIGHWWTCALCIACRPTGKGLVWRNIAKVYPKWNTMLQVTHSQDEQFYVHRFPFSSESVINMNSILFDSFRKISRKVEYHPKKYISFFIDKIEVHWTPRMSNPIQRPHELNNQSPAPSELRDPQIVLLPCGLDHSVNSSM